MKRWMSSPGLTSATSVLDDGIIVSDIQSHKIPIENSKGTKKIFLRKTSSNPIKSNTWSNTNISSTQVITNEPESKTSYTGYSICADQNNVYSAQSSTNLHTSAHINISALRMDGNPFRSNTWSNSNIADTQVITNEPQSKTLYAGYSICTNQDNEANEFYSTHSTRNLHPSPHINHSTLRMEECFPCCVFYGCFAGALYHCLWEDDVGYESSDVLPKLMASEESCSKNLLKAGVVCACSPCFLCFIGWHTC